MGLDISTQIPEWLSADLIESFRETLRKCPTPLSDEEIAHWKYDGDNDSLKADARIAFDILSAYGLLEEAKS